MQAFHRLKFFWENGASLDIEWPGGSEGAGVQPPNIPYLSEATEERLPDVHARRGVPAICWRDDGHVLFDPLQLRENTEYLVDITLPISLDDAKGRWCADNSWPLSTVRNAYRSEPAKRWLKDGDHVTITGRLNFASYVGIAQLSLPNVRPVQFEVACAKIGYFDDFRSLLEAIAEEYSGLLLEIESPTSSLFSLTDATGPRFLTVLFLMRYLMDEARLPASVEHILASMRSKIYISGHHVPIGLNREPLTGDVLDKLPLADLQRGGALASMFSGFTPRQVMETTKHDTFDTPENRYVKSFLGALLHTAETLRDELLRRGREVTGRQVDRWCLRISDWLRHSAWNEVRTMTHFPSNSQILQKAAGYRDVLGADIQLHLGLTLPWDSGLSESAEIHGDLRPISRLYEFWCFFLLRAILRDLCGAEIKHKSNLIREIRGGLSVVLRKGRESSLEFEYSDFSGTKAKVTLFYNRKFPRQRTGTTEWQESYSSVFNPDYSLQIVASEGEAVHWLHFDAKYRLDFELWENEMDQSDETTGEPQDSIDEEGELREMYKRDDLFKMHTYRDALLGSRGSYILFPGSTNEENIFIRYPGIEYPNNGPNIPSVGAFQASPSNRTEQGLTLKRFIKGCLDLILCSADYREETGFFNS